MIKRILNFCKVTILTSPIQFFLNLFFVVSISGLHILAVFSQKLAIDAMVNNTGPNDFKLYIPVLLMFAVMTLSGNYANFENFIIRTYTKNAHKLFSKLFLYKSNEKEHDVFYDSVFYDNYSFAKSQIGKATHIVISVFNNLTYQLFQVIVAATAISIFNVYVGLATLVMGIATAFINKWFVKKQMALNRKFVPYQRKAGYFSSLLRSRGASKELRIYRLKEKFFGVWKENFEKQAKEEYAFIIKYHVISFLMSFVSLIISYGFTIYFLYRVLTGDLEPGNGILLNALFRTLYSGIEKIINEFVNNLNANYKYSKAYTDFVGDIPYKELTKIGNLKIDMPGLKYGEFEKLEIKGLTYKYPNSQNGVINGIDLTINKGEIVAILGYNGSGKSTLSKIMAGVLKNYQGEILLNGTNIKQLEDCEYSKYFGVGFQDFTKYSLPLKENISLGCVEKMNDDEEIKIASIKGNINEFVSTLKNGYDTFLGKEFTSEGQDISGGQWQRIILSRAYMGEPEFIMLDEPTASIDPLEEIRLINQFDSIIKNKTAILISHRIGFARLCKRILIMENGLIIEEGSHEQLLEKKGVYFNLFSSQRALYNEESEVVVNG